MHSLPKHNYYNVPKYAAHRQKNNLDMSDVVRKLEQVVKRMDIEEAAKEEERRRQMAEKIRLEEEQLRLEAESAKLRLISFQRELNEMKNHNSHQIVTTSDVGESARNKLRLLQGDSIPDEALNKSISSLDLEGDKSSVPVTSSGRYNGIRRSGYVDGSQGESFSSIHSSDSDDGERSEKRRGRRPRKSDRDFDQIPRQGSLRNVKSSSAHPDYPSTNDNHVLHRTGSQSRIWNNTLPEPIPPPAVDGNIFPPPPNYNAAIELSQADSSRLATNLGPANPGMIHQASLRKLTTSRRNPNSLSRQRSLTPPKKTYSTSRNACLEMAAAAAKQDSLYAPQNILVTSSIVRHDNKVSSQTNQASKVPFRVVKQNTEMKVQALKAKNDIRVINIPTHQGKFSHSTNGCAVISPLVVSHHLRSRGSVKDEEIVSIIDTECGPLLREIRGKLGLEGDALIIPSDVHDHLVDKKLLRQEKFVGVAGGNIMDPDHLAEFLKLLEGGENKSHINKRTGATLFYREHVVSIVKVPLTGGKWCFDLIDSLPGSNGQATRTRCRDLDALECYLLFYASSKISESKCAYIDKNQWSDALADFDPRVFQGFVWGD
jgi:hypothetical protein